MCGKRIEMVALSVEGISKADWNKAPTFFQDKPEKKPLKSGKGSSQFYNFRG
jgi:hypothetical protein